jgi:hypothetical protein
MRRPSIGPAFRMSLLGTSIVAVIVVAVGWSMRATDERKQREMGKPDPKILRQWEDARRDAGKPVH